MMAGAVESAIQPSKILKILCSLFLWLLQNEFGKGMTGISTMARQVR